MYYSGTKITMVSVSVSVSPMSTEKKVGMR